MRLKRLSVSYNADNQLTQYPYTTPFSGAAPADTSVSFTAQGHTQEEKSGAWQRNYRYNAAERLIETSQNGQTTSYRYDPFGRRISKTSESGAASTTMYFLYSETGLLAEANSHGQLRKAYGFDPRPALLGVWSTDPIWQADLTNNSLTNGATSYHYLHTDHLATPVLATDKAGSVTWKGASEAFGATMPTVEATQMNLRFPGQYWDQETQTHYNFNRDYLPGLGRYVQGDPIGLDGGLNIFAYVKLNPLVDFDPRGLKPAGDPEPGIIDWAKDHACSKGCDWVYKKCRETWMRYCVSFGRSTVCAELCEFQVPEICQREKEKRCPDPVSCNGSEGGSLG